MNSKSILSGTLLIVACIASTYFLMGMISREPAQKSFAQQFAEIVNNLPKSGPHIPELRQSLNEIQKALQQKNPDLNLALASLRSLQDGNLKALKFSTPFGTITGEHLVDIYFDNFMKQLESATKASPAIFSEAKSQKKFAERLAEILKNLPETGQNIPQFRNALTIVLKTFQDPRARLEDILRMLQKIKQSSLKDMQFTTPDMGTLTGEQLMALYINDFINDVAAEIQAYQPHIPGRPHGLVNKQNSCFMNAAVQSVASLEKLTTVLLKHAFDDFYKADSLAAHYIKLLNAIQTERVAVIDPLPFCLQAWKIFPERSQQDASEFVLLLLDALASTDVNRARMPQGINKDVIDLLNITIAQQSSRNGTIVLAYENDYLGVPAIAIDAAHKTLMDCLQSYFTKEKHPTDSSQQVGRTLQTASNYFLIRLVREIWQRQTGKQFKNEQAITFPLENLNISPLNLNGKSFPLYRCKAFMVHIGTPLAGHYIAYIRMQNNWFICDDTHVAPVELNEVREFASQGIITRHQQVLTPVMFFYEQQ